MLALKISTIDLEGRFIHYYLIKLIFDLERESKYPENWFYSTLSFKMFCCQRLIDGASDAS